MKPGEAYNLSDLGFANDIASGYRSDLAEGWQVRVFRDANGAGPCWIIGSKDPRSFSFGSFNDQATSIRLERVGQFPANCN